MRWNWNGRWQELTGSAACSREQGSRSGSCSLLLAFGDDTSVALGRFFGSLHLLGIQRLLDPAIGGIDVLLVLVRRVVQIGALTNQQVHVGHRVIVVRIDLQRFLKI